MVETRIPARTRAPQRPLAGRAVVTFLATDVVGSTERIAEIGDRAWRLLLDRHDQLIRRHLDEFGGRELGSAGDGFLAAFSRPMSAVACAVAIRSSLAGIHLKVRAGVHTGGCEIRRERFAGMALHITARVSAAAGASEILVTDAVKDLLSGLSVVFVDHGLYDLKGVPGSWRLHSVRQVADTTFQAARRVQKDWIQRRGRRGKRWIGASSAALVAISLFAAGQALSDSGSDTSPIAAALSVNGTIAQTQRVGDRFELQLQPQARAPRKVVGRYAVLRSLIWSDDGCRLAFVGGNTPNLVHVFVVDPAGSLTKVTRSPADFRVLDWSANRTHLLVSSGKVGTGSLYSINIRSEAIAKTSIGRFDPDRRSPAVRRSC